MGKYIVVLATYPSKKEAMRVTNKLFDKKLIACANIMSGVNSIFYWKGRINKADEVLCVMKSLKSRFRSIAMEIQKLHSYEVPEVVAISICGGSANYLKWIGESVKRR